MIRIAAGIPAGPALGPSGPAFSPSGRASASPLRAAAVALAAVARATVDADARATVDADARATVDASARVYGDAIACPYVRRPSARVSRRALLAFAVVLAALLGLPGELAAQHAVPLDPQNPRAVRAGAVAEMLLAGDRMGAEGYIRANGDSAYAASRRLGEELESIAPLASRELRVQAFVRPGPGAPAGFAEDAVAVMLASAAGPASEVLLVRVSTTAPYRILGLSLMRMGGQERP